MLDDKDIVKLLGAMELKFSTKVDFETFKDEYSRDFADLQTSVDVYAGKADKFFQELVMLSSQNKRHEKWIVRIAEKLGMKLEY